MFNLDMCRCAPSHSSWLISGVGQQGQLFIVSSRFTPRINDDHGRPWSPRYLMVDHGSSWTTVKYCGDDHGQPVTHKSAMVARGRVTCNNGRPWTTMVAHGQIDCDRVWPWSSHMTMFLYITASMNSVWWWSDTACIILKWLYLHDNVLLSSFCEILKVLGLQYASANQDTAYIRLPNILVLSICKCSQHSLEYMKTMLIKVNKVEYS